MPNKKKTKKQKKPAVTPQMVNRMVELGAAHEPSVRQMIRPGSEAHDPATGLDGVVTHWYVEMDGTRGAIFQPKGTVPGGEPHECYTVQPSRLTRVKWMPEIYLPLVLLGNVVEHKISGIKGMVVAVCLHNTGCVHLEVQPSGLNKEGKRHKARNFEINECRGHRLLDNKSREQIEAERQETPSPSDYPVERGHFL